ncbi:MAG: hypothetical protein LC541_02230 [Candidatus Thiodiazotropha sp.]|nr:hypothetical protein [Candidatus Thiodiazotropha sp.]MCM8882139.1 hypothetical protein [Candidatus Thiodiazotropha sp.]MCM8919084.1 hypothetical protein [Candidatus Thiodiazotropha sp.]MCU7872901.1 hypothetical protein [Candidatus Thiodiazotropha sp. (ex Lucinoma borealis)]
MSSFSLSKLLESLMNLYYRIAELVLRQRIDTYHDKKGSSTTHDISVPLNEHIEELANKTKEANPEDDEKNGTVALETADNKAIARPLKINIIQKGWNGLVNLFAKRSSDVVVHPHLSTKMQRSVHQHLNAALRHARKGDIDNAKLHADLTSNALDVLSNYMPEDEFIQFKQQISLELKQDREQDIFKELIETLE